MENKKTKSNKEKKISIFKKLNPYVGNKKAFIPAAIILSAISAFLNILPFYYVWKIANELFAKGSAISSTNVKHYALMVFLYSVLGILTYFIALMLSHWAAFEIEIGLKKTGFERVMRMPLGFFNKESSGKIRKVINDGAGQTHTFLAHQLPDMAGTIITPILILIIFFYFDWRLGIAALIPVIISFIIMSSMTNKEAKEFQDRYMNALEDMSNEAVEYVRAIPVVKTFGQSVKSFTRFYNSIANYKDLVIIYTKMWAKPYSVYLAIVESTALFLIPACVLIIGNDAEIGVIISNFVLYILVAPLLAQIMMRSMYFTQQKTIADQAIDRFNALFDFNDMTYPEKGVAFEEQSIEFKDVSFSYDGEKNVLDGVSFKVNKGETLALVGASGSGKTTIARLAARFWDVNEGEVLIGGKNIKDYAKEDLMEHISFVFQNTQLFKTTLRENISFGKTVSNEEIEQALLKSRSKEIIDYLDDGLDTVIGTKGTYLSGGEQQRIALARAFIKNAPIVLLDEATAFADPENEHLIQAALRDLSDGKTTIMIAHRMTTVKDADYIAVIDDGQIVEYGNHESLMLKGGMYKKMWDEYQSSIHWNIKKGA